MFFLFAQKLADDRWYFAAFKDGVIQQEQIDDYDSLISSFSWSLHESERVLYTDPSFTLKENDAVLVEPLEFNGVSKFLLKRKNNLHVNKYVIAATIIIVLLIAWLVDYNFDSNSNLKQPNHIPASQIYNDIHRTHSYASDALVSSINLLLDMSSLPKEMQANRVSVNGQQLILPITESNKLLPSVKKQWLASQPQFSALYQDSSIRFQLRKPDKWQPYFVNGYTAFFKESLIYLGAELVSQGSQDIDGVTVTTYALNFSGEVPLALVIAEILDRPFVTASRVEVELDDKYQISTLNMTLNIQGKDYD